MNAPLHLCTHIRNQDGATALLISIKG